MENYQREFIEFTYQHQVLRFGEFTLKSGRVSPYFFNAGLFNTSQTLAKLGGFYADAIENSGIQYDMLFGPAYKGIPLVSTTAVALAHNYDKDVPFAFNRKEVKGHGEGGLMVGAPLQGKVIIIDDVISAGVTIREIIPLIQEAGAQVAAIAISVDRQERGQGELSASQEVEQDMNIPVINVVGLEHIIEYLTDKPEMKTHLDSIKAYQAQYGARL